MPVSQLIKAFAFCLLVRNSNYLPGHIPALVYFANGQTDELP